MKKIYLTILFTLAASVGMSWATTNSITINDSSHGSVVASSSSAAAGETITLTATPDDGYQLKSISGVYVLVSETLNATSETVNGNKFQAQATARNNYGWRVFINSGTPNTLTDSTINRTTLKKKIEFTSTWGNGRNNNMLSVSAGTLSFDGNNPSTTVTINGINATSVTISGSGTNAGQTWCISSVKVYYEGTDEVELEISDTENANVKTFTMVDGDVTISAEFEPAPTPADVYSVAGTMNEWSTIANQMTLVGEDLYMAEMTLSGYKEFKIVKNHAVWYGSSTIYRRLSDVNLWDAEDVNDQPNDNIAFELASTSVVKFYWDAANDKVYLTLNPATITCTVAGAADLVGVDWKPSAVANDMTNNGDSTFTLLKEDVTLNVGDHGYKVAYNHSWDVNFGDAEGNNAIVNITEAGIYDVTFSFNWKTKEVSAVAVLQEPVVVIPVVKLTGNFTNPEWDAESAITLVDNGDGTCSVTQHFAVDVISFKLIVDGNWYGDQNHSKMTRGNQGEGWEIAYDIGYNNTQLDVDLEGDYVFTYTYATRKLLVTYPLIVREAANTNYQSLCTPYDATLDGATAYTVGAASESGVTLNPVVGNLEAGHSYIIKPTEIGTVTVNFVAEGTSTTTPVEPNGTGLYGVLVNNYVYNYATEKGKAWVNVFVLLNDDMFHQVVSGGEVTITPTHAYLHIEGQEIVPNPGAPGVRIIETATNIENIEGNETAVKFIENGKLFIRKNGVVYDVTGAVVK
jgi:hypothetical protein